MFFLRLIEFIILSMVLWMIFTQIIFPIFEDRSLFPIFRKRYNKLQDDLSEVNQQAREKDLEKEIQAKKDSLNQPEKE